MITSGTFNEVNKKAYATREVIIHHQTMFKQY